MKVSNRRESSVIPAGPSIRLDTLNSQRVPSLVHQLEQHSRIDGYFTGHPISRILDDFCKQLA